MAWCRTGDRPLSEPMMAQFADACLRHSDSFTHWGRGTHICVGNLISIGSDNGLSPVQRQAIIWTNAGLLSIGPLETNFSEISIEMHTFSFKKMCLKKSSGKWRPFCLGLNVKALDVLSRWGIILRSTVWTYDISWFSLPLLLQNRSQTDPRFRFAQKTASEKVFSSILAANKCCQSTAGYISFETN